ncbi:hypothetical protein V8E54_007856 [Elaphomyces granulatus]
MAISQLVSNLLWRVRTATAEFRVFTGDLNLTQNILRQLQSNWGILASRLGESERNTVRSIFKGIRRGLNELENQLERHQNVGGIRHGIANLRFSNHLADLQHRLQFRMSALQLLAQNLSIMQGNRIEEALQVFREALEEQRRSDQQERGLQPGDENEQEWQENICAFQYYVHYPREVPTGRAISSTSSDSRSYLIEKWRHEVTEAESFNMASLEATESTITRELSRNYLMILRVTLFSNSITQVYEQLLVPQAISPNGYRARLHGVSADDANAVECFALFYLSFLAYLPLSFL